VGLASNYRVLPHPPPVDAGHSRGCDGNEAVSGGRSPPYPTAAPTGAPRRPLGAAAGPAAATAAHPPPATPWEAGRWAACAAATTGRRGIYGAANGPPRVASASPMVAAAARATHLRRADASSGRRARCARPRVAAAATPRAAAEGAVTAPRCLWWGWPPTTSAGGCRHASAAPRGHAGQPCHLPGGGRKHKQQGNKKGGNKGHDDRAAVGACVVARGTAHRPA